MGSVCLSVIICELELNPESKAQKGIDIGYWILDIGDWRLEIGDWILEIGYWILEIRV
jgi:hypothetical protein